LQAEEAQLERVRAEMSQQAHVEAAALGSMRGQVAELQNVLAGLNQQVAAEQAVRRSDVQVRVGVCLWTRCRCHDGISSTACPCALFNVVVCNACK
jgi:hypothetical protein